MAGSLLGRLALAFGPAPDGVRGPPIGKLLVEAWHAPFLIPGVRAAPAVSPARNPHRVIVVPGFLAHAAMMRPMIAALRAAGHKADDWAMGLNLGVTPETLGKLAQRLHAEPEPVSLVGWSLGGLIAREVSRLAPDRVRCVISMGSPFSGDLHANNAWRLYQAVTGQDVNHPPVEGDLAHKPPVRTVALWSANDGIVSAASARGNPDERDEAVELDCTHLDFAGHRDVIAEVLRQLDRD